MPTPMKTPSARTLRERRAKLVNLLMGSYFLSQTDADYLADKAVEKAKCGEDFTTQLKFNGLQGPITVGLTVGVYVSTSLTGDSAAFSMKTKVG